MKLYSACYQHGMPFSMIPRIKETVLVKSGRQMTDENSVLVVWGGADISPSYYGQQAHHTSQTPGGPSVRDRMEWDCMERAVERGIPIIGVCRGAQMACAMAGGLLIQDCKGHTSSHQMLTDKGEQYKTSSLHHQMMYPWEVEHHLIAWSLPRDENDVPFRTKINSLKVGSAHEWVDASGRECAVPFFEKEPEIVYFPKIKALAIQGHPEFMDEGAPYVRYCNRLIQEYLLNNVKVPA